MTELGKLPNGFVLFNADEKIKIIIQWISNTNILIHFDTTEYDKTRTNGMWFTKDYNISRKDNLKLCEALDKLYNTRLDMMRKNPSKYAYLTIEGKSIPLFSTISGDKTKILYPSPSTAVKNHLKDCAWFGITKFNEDGYELSFKRVISNPNYRNIFITDNNIIPEVFSLYNECFQSIATLATKKYVDVNTKFLETINNDLSDTKKLKLTN